MIIAPLIGTDRAELFSQLDLFFALKPDCAEIRADALRLSPESAAQAVSDCALRIREKCASGERFQILLTLKGESLALFRLIDPMDYDWVDLDAQVLLSRPDLAQFGEKLGSRLIVSTHDLEGRERVGTLPGVIQSCRERFPQATIKLAYAVADEDEAASFLEWIRLLSSEMQIIGVPMGEAGAAARLRSLEYGSFGAYGYLTEPNAPGQPHIRALLSLGKTLY